MNTEQWDRVRQVFKAALSLPPGQRDGFLQLHCGDDAEVRTEARRLLAAHGAPSALAPASDSSDEEGFVIPLTQITEWLPPSTAQLARQKNPLALPARIKDRYLIERELGRGGLGIVYLARDEKLRGKQVVVKLLLGAALSAEDLDWMHNHFNLEQEALARINHPGVVGILDADEWEGRPFIVMEYINGETLRTVINRSGQSGQTGPSGQSEQAGVSFARTAELARQIGRALAAAHSSHVYHRDLKPANVMLQNLGEGQEMVKLIDFGIATVRQSQVDTSHDHTRIAGTWPYMAPEQMLGKPSAASDIFAMGVIAYELLTGRVPFKADSLIELYNLQGKGEFILPSVLRPGLPPQAEAAIARALSFDETQRQPSASQFGEELFQALMSPPVAVLGQSPAPANFTGQRATILYKRHAQPDERLVKLIEESLRARGYRVFIDRHLAIGVEWAKEIERQLRTADFVIPLLSAASVDSAMLVEELGVAYESWQQQGRPLLLPVRVNFSNPLPEALGAILNPIQYAMWTGEQDDEMLLARLLDSIENPSPAPPVNCVARFGRFEQFEPIGGAMPPDSRFYIPRPTDQEFLAAIERRDSIVLVKGARQMGKTSLLARGLRQARAGGARVVLTDFQMLDAAHLATVDALFLAFAESIVEQLDLDCVPGEQWNPRSGANVNFARFLRREVLGKLTEHLVWGLDEVDRLFSCEFGSQVFALFRSWHNARALDPAAPWHRLTLAIAYATEAHLFITDINQSPFNVGTRLALDDFTPAQVDELNGRYGAPLGDRAEASRFYRLVGGQPYLVQRGLHQMASQGARLAAFEEQADRDEGPLGDHLRRMLFVLAQQPALCEAVREVLGGRRCSSAESFYRLRSAGVMAGDAAQEARMGCLTCGGVGGKAFQDTKPHRSKHPQVRQPAAQLSAARSIGQTENC